MSLFPETLSSSDFPSIFWTDSVPHFQDAWSLPTFISSLSALTHMQSCQFHPRPNNRPTSDSSPDFYKSASTYLLDLSTWPTAQIERIQIGICHPSLSLSSVNRSNVFPIVPARDLRVSFAPQSSQIPNPVFASKMSPGHFALDSFLDAIGCLPVSLPAISSPCCHVFLIRKYQKKTNSNLIRSLPS